MADEMQPLITTEVTVPESVDPAEVTYAERLTKSKGILSGETWIQLTLQFLYSHNKSDLLILKTIKQSIEMRNSVCHSATIYANTLMHAGTTVDTFLRENLDWLSRATNWAKFSATAGLGVIHRGHLQQGRSLMAPYLPQSGSGGGSPYSEGGALYALGLIHANHGGGSGSNSGESITAPGGG
ncbi:putative armadillo-like helical protein [Helianthus annuus]|nr:putative armadillo-like helical protein [Helianthus annuus]